MLKHLLTSGIRNLIKYRFFTLLNITGLAIGMSATIMILSWTSFHLSFDRHFPNHENIYRILQRLTFNEEVTWAITQGLVGESISEEIPGIEDFSRTLGSSMKLQIENGEEYEERILFADPSFMDIFSISCLKKSIENPLSIPNCIVISEKLSRKIFGDEDAIGKTISLYGRMNMTVTGVFKDLPVTTHISFEALLNFDELNKSFGFSTERWNNSGYHTYVQLNEEADPILINQKLKHHLLDKPIISEPETTLLELQNLSDIHTTTGIDFENAKTVSNKYVKIFLLIGIFVLIIASINYINLDTAKAGKRSKEIGIKKITGASPLLLRRQFLSESLIISFIAIILAIIMVSISKSFFYQATGINVQFNLNDPGSYLFLIIIWLTTGMISGWYPAIYLSRIRPVSILNARSVSLKSGLSTRTILVVFQFSLTILFVIGTLSIYRQIDHMTDFPLGYSKENIVYFNGSRDLIKSFDALEQKLMSNPKIESVCRSGAGLDRFYAFSNSLWHWPGQDSDRETLFRCVNIGYDFFETHQMEIVEGHAPSRTLFTDTMNAIIINEAAAKMMNLERTTGTKVSYYEEEEPFTIIAVVKDFHYTSLHEEIEPQILIVNPVDCRVISCRLDGVNNKETIDQIKKTVNTIVPDDNLSINDLQTVLDNAYKEDKITGRLLIMFTVLSILVSILGLVGLTSFVIHQRIPEIGIRKTLGASKIRIFRLFSWQYLKLIFSAVVISWPIAYFAIKSFLQSYPNRISMPWWNFIIAGIFAILFVQVSLIIVSSRNLRKNVVDCLRHE